MHWSKKNKDWFDENNLTKDNHFSEHISSDETWQEEPFSNIINDAETDIPFEEQDILGDALRKRISKKDTAISDATRLQHQEFINRKTIDELPLYSAQDFKLMKDAVLFNALAYHRPTFKDGSPMTDQQIVENVATLLEIESGRGPNPKPSLDEMRLMEKCKTWYDVASQREDYKEMPKRADGKMFSKEEIDELVSEYRDLRTNEPQQFAKLELELVGESKVESGEWKKTEFRFDEQESGDRKQWVCNKDETHDGKIMHVRYIAFRDPSLVAKPGTVGTFYYSVRSETINPNNKRLKKVFIDLKLPLVKEQKNLSQEEVPTERRMVA